MIETWGDAVAFTFRTRKAWRSGNGKQACLINTNHISRILGDDFKLTDFSRSVLRDLTFNLEDYGHSDATINRIIAAYSTVLNHCNEEEVIDVPVPRIPRRKEIAGRPNYFTKEQVNSIVDHLNYTSRADIVRFAALTGGRQGELLKLQVKDIDLDAGLIYFGGRPGFNTKTGDWRTVPIHTHLAPVIDRRINGAPPDALVFDEWHTRDQLLRKFKQWVRDVGIEPHYVFHCLRHSFATWHIEANTPIRVLMDLMGHKKIETTLRYAKATDKARTEAISSFVS